MFDRVHRSRQKALDEAGFESPNPAQDINLRVGLETATQLADAFGRNARSEVRPLEAGSSYGMSEGL